MTEWLLIFVFAGRLAVSGPHDLRVCLWMAEAQTGSPTAMCVHKDRPREQKP